MKIIVKNRSNQSMSHMGPYLKSFLPFAQKRLGFNRPPTIFFDSDTDNSKKVLGKTAYYDPDASEVVVFVDKRHPKDILRSLSHELVHHSQNCRGDLEPEIAGETGPGYAQTNPHMRQMESEAFEKGNLCMRDWEDNVKIQLSMQVELQETNYLHITGDSHKMATYEQLKEQITKKVVKALKEKMNEGNKKPDNDGDGVPPWADKDDNDPEVQEEACASGDAEEDKELEERKKRNDPRNDRGIPQRMKMNEEELDEEEEIVNEEEDPKPEDDPEVKPMEKDDPRSEERWVTEGTISNDHWYQNQLFEKLSKRWTK